MTNYIKKLITEMVADRNRPVESRTNYYLTELYKELDRFDPRDFEPAVQHKLVWARGRLMYLKDVDARHGDSMRIEFLEQLLPILDAYRGEGSRGVQRSFAYINDADLRRIIERDYAELCLKLFPSGAWKSTVIMAGSILEAILTDVLSAPSCIGRTMASSKAPTGKDIIKGEWKLEKLVAAASDIGILSKDRAETVDQVLRDYRNFVHPKKEIRSAHECTEAEGLLAKGALDGVCNYLEATL